MTTKQAETAQHAQPTSQPQHGQAALEHRYGQIGISAVAAAVRYQGAAKNPAYAPVPLPTDRWSADTAA
jgi:hypothetical protein